MKSFNMLMMAALTILSLSAFSQDAQKNKTKAPKSKSETVKYSCPMHPDQVSNKPGQCPKCGMEMTKAKKDVTKMYSCPMHPEVTSDKPGKCPKCGMELVKSQKEEAKIYSCPMHPEVTSNKPGKCPKCNMDLKDKNDHSEHHD